MFHGKRHFNTAGRLHVYLFKDIYAAKGALKVFAFFLSVPCISTFFPRLPSFKGHEGAIARWWAHVVESTEMTVWSLPDSTNISLFLIPDFWHLLIITGIYRFHAAFKVDVKPKLSPFTVLITHCRSHREWFIREWCCSKWKIVCVFIIFISYLITCSTFETALVFGRRQEYFSIPPCKRWICSNTVCNTHQKHQICH